jgi:chemotaxis signal transduction protein
MDMYRGIPQGLASEEYGLEILKVREIFGYMDITAIPQTPDYVKGVINLRGQVIPVVDLRAKFGMECACQASVGHPWPHIYLLEK